MGVRHQASWLVIVLLWAFAEATVFFLVPDIALTAVLVIFGISAALRMARYAAIVAAIGGAVMYVFAARDPEAAFAVIRSVPLIGDDLIVRVQQEFSGVWPIALGIGAITGAPYKIYASVAGTQGVSIMLFLVVSVIARFSRFALLIGIFAAGQLVLRRIGCAHWDWRFFGLFWGAIYMTYTIIRLSAS